MNPTFRRICLFSTILLVSASFLACEPSGEKKGVKSFTNSKTGLTGDRAKHYVDFSFDFPASWKLTREEGDKESNFVTVERGFANKDGTFTQEKFAVGTFWGKGSGDKAVLDQKGDELKAKARDLIVAQLKAQIAQGFAGSKITKEGLTKVSGLDGYEVCFATEFKPDEESIKVWGRFVLVPNPDGSENGVSIVMLGTSFAPELKEEKDLGAKGEMPTILKSFKLGKAKP